MNVGTYFKIAYRWWWLVFISAALAGTSSYIYSSQLPKIYFAQSTVRVGLSIGEVTAIDERTIRTTSTLADFYSQLVSRNQITQGVIDRHNLQMSAGDLSGMIGTSVQNGQFVTITVLDIDPERAGYLANALADELILQSPQNDKDRQEIEQNIREDMDDAREKINRYKVEIARAQEVVDNTNSAAERQESRDDIKELEQLKSEQQTNYTLMSNSLSESSPNQLTVLERSAGGWEIGPNVRNNVIMAVAVGFALAVAGIIVIEFFDDTLTWQDGMTTVGDATVLGITGKMMSGSAKIVTHDKLWSPEANALRELRDSIYLATEDRPLSTLLVTSPLTGAGKSFITSNLGVTIATAAGSTNVTSSTRSNNTNIILVDADLRKPTLHEIFDIPNVVGLSDVLIAPESAIEATLKQALRPTYLDNMFVLPAGKITADPGSLLNSIQFINIIRYLKQRSQIVIIDSAPILEAVETRAIDNIVDGTLMVTSSGRTRKKVVNLALDYFGSKKKNNFLGLVFNRVTLPYGQEYYAGQQLQTQQSGDSFWAKLWPRRRQQRSQSTLSLAEAAIHLGVKEETVRRWCETGRIPGIKTGSRWKVRMEDLDEYITFYKLNNKNIDRVLDQSADASARNFNGKASYDKPIINELPAEIEDVDAVLARE